MSGTAERRTDGPTLVCGATGRQGRAVALRLLGRGRRVRAMTRDPARAADLAALGAEVVRGDLLDGPSVAAALRGVRRVFLMTSWREAGLAGEVRQGVTMADAAKAAGVEHLVYTSVGCAARRTGVPHFDTKREVEQYIVGTGLPHTFLRPVFFMENFLSPWFLPSLRRGLLSLPLAADRPVQMVAVDDIGAFGAAALLDPGRFANRAVGLAGDEVTLAEATTLLSTAAGIPIRYERMPPDQARQAFCPNWQAMFRWFDAVGYAVDIPALNAGWGVRMATLYTAIVAAGWSTHLRSGDRSAAGA